MCFNVAMAVDLRWHRNRYLNEISKCWGLVLYMRVKSLIQTYHKTIPSIDSQGVFQWMCTIQYMFKKNMVELCWCDLYNASMRYRKQVI